MPQPQPQAEGKAGMPPAWAPPDAVAREFGVPRTRLFRWIKAGEVESVRVGHRRLVRLGSVDELLRSLAAGGR